LFIPGPKEKREKCQLLLYSIFYNNCPIWLGEEWELGLDRQAGEMQVAEIAARWGEFDDFLDDELAAVELDGVADHWLGF
jgi:hypothetical protein